MSRKAHGQVRRSQVITTYGPGALIDLPRHSAIVGGLDTWPKTSDLEEIVEPRLARKLELMTGVAAPRLFAPPPDSNDPARAGAGHRRVALPGVVRRAGGAAAARSASARAGSSTARRSTRRAASTAGTVVATRFVRACPQGHVDDLDWRCFVHGAEDDCRRQLWLDERGTSGDLATSSCAASAASRAACYEATRARAEPARHLPRRAAVAGPERRTRTASCRAAC